MGEWKKDCLWQVTKIAEQVRTGCSGSLTPSHTHTGTPADHRSHLLCQVDPAIPRLRCDVHFHSPKQSRRQQGEWDHDTCLLPRWCHRESRQLYSCESSQLVEKAGRRIHFCCVWAGRFHVKWRWQDDVSLKVTHLWDYVKVGQNLLSMSSSESDWSFRLSCVRCYGLSDSPTANCGVE